MVVKNPVFDCGSFRSLNCCRVDTLVVFQSRDLCSGQLLALLCRDHLLWKCWPGNERRGWQEVTTLITPPGRWLDTMLGVVFILAVCVSMDEHSHEENEGDDSKEAVSQDRSRLHDFLCFESAKESGRWCSVKSFFLTGNFLSSLSSCVLSAQMPPAEQHRLWVGKDGDPCAWPHWEAFVLQDEILPSELLSRHHFRHGDKPEYDESNSLIKRWFWSK